LNDNIYYCSGKRRPSDTHGVVESVPDVTNERSNGTSTFENSGSSRASPIAGKSTKVRVIDTEGVLLKLRIKLISYILHVQLIFS